MPANVSFDRYETKSRGTVYKIRFDRISMAFLGDNNYIQLFKNTEYVMVKPAQLSPGSKNNTFLVNRNRSQGSVNVGRLVSTGFLHKDLFGKKYKVRKDREGNLYICLMEEIKEGDE